MLACRRIAASRPNRAGLLTSHRIDPLAELLEIASRILHSRGYRHDLYPAQWVALRFLSDGKPGRRTATDLARYQGLANGPVSRTVRTLIGKGLIRKSKEQPRGRAEWLELTEAGRALLADDPLEDVRKALSGLTGEQIEAMAIGLEAVARLGDTGRPLTKGRDRP